MAVVHSIHSPYYDFDNLYPQGEEQEQLGMARPGDNGSRPHRSAGTGMMGPHSGTAIEECGP